MLYIYPQQSFLQKLIQHEKERRIFNYIADKEYIFFYKLIYQS